MHRQGRAGDGAVRFQSTPPVAGGRCLFNPTAGAPAQCFNPRPPLPGDDASTDHEGSAQPRRFNPRPPLPGDDACRHSASTISESGFNPRPPLPGDDAGCRRGKKQGCHVSIHAPRCRGTMPCRVANQSDLFNVSIHAPRCRGTMRLLGRCRGRRIQFQSTPPVAGGRCYMPEMQTCTVVSFNPRPPLPGDDASLIAFCDFFLRVSIHAPRCRGTMQPQPRPHAER